MHPTAAATWVEHQPGDHSACHGIETFYMAGLVATRVTQWFATIKAWFTQYHRGATVIRASTLSTADGCSGIRAPFVAPE